MSDNSIELGMFIGFIIGVVGTSVVCCGTPSVIDLDRPMIVNSVSSNDKNTWNIDMDFSIIDLKMSEQPNLRSGDKVKFVLKKVEDNSK